jgi:hypothetical protein
MKVVASKAVYYTGTYVLRRQGNTVTIVLNQEAQGKLSGSMSSMTGACFQIDGVVESGVAMIKTE